MRTLDELKEIFFFEGKKHFSEDDYNLLLEANNYTEELLTHAKAPQMLEGFNPYEHQLKATIIVLKELNFGIDAIIATMMARNKIPENYKEHSLFKKLSPETISFIQNIQKITEFDFIDVEAKAEYFRKLLINISVDIRVVMIVLIDRLVSMREIVCFNSDYQKKISIESMYLYAPLAHRMGLYNIYTELSTRSFKHTNKEEYEEIKNKLDEIIKKDNDFLPDFIKPIELSVKETNVPFEIKSRIKSPFSIWKKINNQNTSIENIHDIYAIRIIFDSDFENEKLLCWQIYALITDIYTPMASRTRDWISIPRENGYESLHTTVQSDNGTWVEIQIRSKRMDKVAEYGPAAHWSYKDKTKKTSLEKWLEDIREVLENDKLALADILENMKPESIADEIFVFTPTKQIKRFSNGATLLDFAYDIHSEIGNRCVGGIINSKNVDKAYKLQNGDTIFIRTSKTQKPTVEWLKIATTTKAKYQIRRSLNEEYDRLVELGKDILKRKIKNWKYNFTEVINEIIVYFDYKFGNDLYHDVATEKLSTQKIKRFLDNIKELSEEKKGAVHAKSKSFNNMYLVMADDETRVRGVYAGCCEIIPGEEVFGFITQNADIKIHSKKCPNAQHLYSRYSYKIIELKWFNTKSSIKQYE
ncbi:HD domain-containing protein [Bacteroidales bacterium OttesenSCG-928-K03]|nr:HD domain-containing protein [Bacteroidales bacterium OttesenSCG-928-K22]MDL2242888.1 HD domain-containing protein [Bacteroidales bacterium OttesenSCG-928-K03]